MTTESGDDALRARFASLRVGDLATVPELEVVLARTAESTRRPRGRRAMAMPALAGAVACGIALLAASAWLWAPPRPATPEGVSLALPGWRTPTDTLLAGGDDSLRPMPWTELPTAALDRSSPHRSQETP